MNPGDVISYTRMCAREGLSLQKGMNYRGLGKASVFLMSRRANSPYVDRIEPDGQTLIYEGHDDVKKPGGPDPKSVDQPEYLPSGKPTANGRFFAAALSAKCGQSRPLVVRVYEKIRAGIWVFVGTCELIDAWRERSGSRDVFKFKLQLVSEGETIDSGFAIPHTRLIPTDVRISVWKRDGGKCIVCGSSDNLHFDHIIPYSRGGTSVTAHNIQLLCARHNLQKYNRIQ